MSCEGCRCTKTRVVAVIVGITVGIILAIGGYGLYTFVNYITQPQSLSMYPFLTNSNATPAVSIGETIDREFQEKDHLPEPKPPFRRKPLYIGVLTLDKYLHTRASACNSTWGQHPGISKLEFFVDSKRKKEHNQRLIYLEDVAESDPYHHHKSFLMLKSICQNHLHDYNWFIRSVDDVYIRMEKLLTMLASLDSSKKIYLGHPSHGLDELSLTLMEGQTFCLGGTGIIFSKKTMEGLCPHLDECMNEFNQGPPDLEIGRCLHKHLGITCSKSHKLRDYFYNSFERNTFNLMEEFLANDKAITLHPLKSDWLMKTLHQYYIKREVTELSQKLESLVLQQNSFQAYIEGHNNTVTLTLGEKGQGKPLEDSSSKTLIITKDGHSFDPESCQPKNPIQLSMFREIEKATRLANTSCNIGNLLQCHKLIDFHYEQTDIGNKYSSNMECKNLAQQTVLAKVALRRPLGVLEVKKYRERILPSKFVVVMSADFGDPLLMEFLMMWKGLVNHSSQGDKNKHALYVLMKNQKTTRKRDLYSHNLDFTMTDLRRWQKRNNIKLKVYRLHSNQSTTKYIENEVSKDIIKDFPDSIVLLGNKAMRFNKHFITKCKSLVRPSKQLYKPRGVENMLLVHTNTTNNGKMFQPVWEMKNPVTCVHSSDLFYKKNPRSKRTKTDKNQMKSIKILNSLDSSIYYEYL